MNNLPCTSLTIKSPADTMEGKAADQEAMQHDRGQSNLPCTLEKAPVGLLLILLLMLLQLTSRKVSDTRCCGRGIRAPSTQSPFLWGM